MNPEPFQFKKRNLFIATILLIEDDNDVRAILRDMLGLEGYTVVEAADVSRKLKRDLSGLSQAASRVEKRLVKNSALEKKLNKIKSLIK
jgi:CheY-like chemotaxis protein